MVGFCFRAKRVLVTGASRGIGFAVAEGFATAGAHVIALADDEGIYEAAERIGSSTGGEVTALRCDITDRLALREMISGLGRLDVLINNAGYERITPILQPGEEVEHTFARIIEVNVIGTFLVTREAIKLMGPGARIVITASIYGKTAIPHFTGYCASKHANIGFMRSLARELGPKGIAVNAVCPGWVNTETSWQSVKVDAALQGRSEKELAAEVLARQSFEGLMEPKDVVSAFLFLASEHAANITGQTLHVDRGELMG